MSRIPRRWSNGSLPSTWPKPRARYARGSRTPHRPTDHQDLGRENHHPRCMELADELALQRIERVVVESTSDYWRPLAYLLEAWGLVVWLVNARDVKRVPGRPKTDKLDAVWLAKLNERGMPRPSFVPPAEIRQLRDYTRLRVDLVEDRTRYKQRVEKLLEDALIKLSTVATDIFGKSGRSMLDALVAGERDPEILADLALGKIRPKQPHSETPSPGASTSITPNSCPSCRTRSTPSAPRSTASHSVSSSCWRNPRRGSSSGASCLAWRNAPTRCCGAPRRDHGHRGDRGADHHRRGRPAATTGKGNPYLKRILAEAAASTARTDTFLGDRYRRLARHRGKLKAVVAVAAPSSSSSGTCWPIRPLASTTPHPATHLQPRPSTRGARPPRHAEPGRLSTNPATTAFRARLRSAPRPGAPTSTGTSDHFSDQCACSTGHSTIQMGERWSV